MTTFSSGAYSSGIDHHSNIVPHRGQRCESPAHPGHYSPRHLPSSVQDGYVGPIVPSQGLKDVRVSDRYDALWTSTSTWTSIPHPSTNGESRFHSVATANSSPMRTLHHPHLYDQLPHSWQRTQDVAQGGQPMISDISPTPSDPPPAVWLSYQNREHPPQPFWAEAHQPILPEQRSPYSELAVNLAFLRKLQEEEEARALASSIPPVTALHDTRFPSAAATILPPTSPNHNSPPDKMRPCESPLLSSVSFSSKTIVIAEPSPATESANEERSPVPFSPSSGTSATWSVNMDSVNATGALRNVKEPRKPSLACTFCRERKIACGRPPSNSPDPTCNQCARRSFKCEYKERVKSVASKKIRK